MHSHIPCRTLAAGALVFTLGSLSAQTPPAPIRSPEVHADGRVTFRFRAPNASAVLLLSLIHI